MKTNHFLKFYRFILLSIVNFFIIINFTYSQVDAGYTAAPFLVISPSPEAAGIGGSGAVLHSDDPFAFFFNPAQLGFAARNNNHISLAFNRLVLIFHLTITKWDTQILQFQVDMIFQNILEFRSRSELDILINTLVTGIGL